MKNKKKKNIQQLAVEIADLEKVIDEGKFQDKNVQSAMSKIKYIIEGLSINDFLELNQLVTKRLQGK